MAENETREPTLGEIMEEIKKSKDEIMKEIGGPGISREPTMGEIMEEIKKCKDEIIKEIEGSRISREPTRSEIMEEIRKSRDEAIKSSEGSRIAIWVTVASFGGAIAIVGVSYFGRFLSSYWDIMSSAIIISAVGIGFMVWSRHMARRAQVRFREKWNEPPPRF